MPEDAFVTLQLACIMMAGLFLMIDAAVAFIQDKRLFTSAPKDIQAAIRPRTTERFRGAHALGWLLLVIAVLMILCPIVWAGWDGIRQGWGFWQLFGRYLAMMLLVKAFDVLFLDWFLLCHSHYYQHYYPETEGCAGFHSFGFNARSHVVQTLLFIPASALLAWICTLL